MAWGCLTEWLLPRGCHAPHSRAPEHCGSHPAHHGAKGKGVACVGRGRGLRRAGRGLHGVGRGFAGGGEGMACVRQGGALRGRALRRVPATTFLRAPSVPTVQACWGDPHFALLTQRCLESVGLSTMRPLISACYFLVDDPRGRGATQTSRVDVPGRTPPSCWAHQRTLCRFPRGPARQA